MADDKGQNAPEIVHRIDIRQDDQVEYWSKRFGCTKSDLKAAVIRVGVLPKDVEADLKRRKLRFTSAW